MSYNRTHKFRVVIQGRKNYRLSHKILEVQDREALDRIWMIVVHNGPSIKKTIMEEVQAIPYAGHLGYQKTLKQIQKTFYWPDLTLEVRDFVLGCEVGQK